MAQRVFVVGLDGATFDLIGPWVSKGLLPNFARCMHEGAYGPLESTIPSMTAQAWTSFLTGKNIGKHGLADFTMRRPGSYDLRVVDARLRDGDSLWKLLSDAGKRVIVINVPMTYPPEPVNGMLISGMDAPSVESSFIFPASMRQELLTAFPAYRIEPKGREFLQKGQFAQFLENLLAIEETRFEVARWLLRRHPWDFFMVVFRATDYVQHWFWKHMDSDHPQRAPGDEAFADAILQVYQRMDEMLGAFLDELDDDVVFALMSDHGAGPASNTIVYLNTWLRDLGLLRFKTESEKGVVGLAARVKRLLVSTILWGAYTELRRQLPSGWKDRLKEWFPQIERKVHSLVLFSEIDWPRTMAYSQELRGTIWINLKGREPQGIVEPGDEYERLCKTLSEGLYELRDPETGETIVEHVYRKEEMYSGPYMDRIPDLIIGFKKKQGKFLYHTGRGALSSRRSPVQTLSAEALRRDLRPNGRHTVHGLFLFRGKPIRRGIEVKGPRIMDIAPTILHLMGQPIPSDMDGKVLTEILSPDFCASNPVQFKETAAQAPHEGTASYSEEEEREIEERLKGLGYI